MQSTSNAVRDYQISRGAVAMSPDEVRAHCEKVFGAAKETPKETVIEQKFELESEPVILGKRSKRAKKSERVQQVYEKTEPKKSDTVVIQYIVSLASGPEVAIPEYATLCKEDGQVLAIGFPISNQLRFKPDRNAEFKIIANGKTYEIFCPGIHLDISELEVSLSIYLIK